MEILRKMKQWLNGFMYDPFDVYDAHKILFFISQMFGLISYRLHRINGTVEYRRSFVISILNIVLVFAFLTGFLYLTKQFLPMMELIANFNIIEIYAYYFQYLLATVEVCANCFFTNKIIKMFKNLQEIDGDFYLINIRISYKKMFVYCLIGIIGIFLQCVLMIAFAHIPIPRLQWYHKVGIYVIFIAPIFVNGYIECQYVTYATMLKNRYRVLNECLATIIENNSNSSNKSANLKKEVWTINNKIVPAIVSTLKCSKPLKVTSPDPNSLLERIMGIHIKLSQTAKLINKGYRLQLLMLILVCFLAVVCAFYIIGVNFISTTTNKKRLENNETFLIWVTANTMALFAIVHATSSLCDEANETARILHKIWNHTSNIKLQDTIEMYSLQMHQNRLKFTVCGLFPLDNSLIYTITASVSTYLIIMIQFSNFNDSNRAKNITLDAS